jgi:hypothetical protein
MQEGAPFVDDVERVTRDLHDDLVSLQLPGEVAEDACGRVGEHHVRVPLERVARAHLRERPVVEVDEAVHRLGRSPEVLLAAACDREGIGVDLEALGGAALIRHAARDLGSAVRRAVVDEHDPLDGA